MRKIEMNAWLTLALLAQASPAWATFDIDRLIMGRTNQSPISWALDIFNTTTLPELHAPEKNTYQHSFEVEYSYTNSLSFEAGLETKETKQDLFQANQIVLETSYMVIQNPFQMTPFIDFIPSLRQGPSEWGFGIESLKNIRSHSFLFLYSANLGKDSNGKWKVESEIEPGIFYRFGLNGIGGMELEYKSSGMLLLDFVLGGRISKNLFWGIEPQLGLNKRSPDFNLTLQLHLYFGQYSTAALE